MTEETIPTNSIPTPKTGKFPSGKKIGRPKKWAKVPIDSSPPSSVPVEPTPSTDIPDGGLDAALAGAGEAPLSPSTTTPSPLPEGVASSSPQVLPQAGAKGAASPEECEALVNFADMIGIIACRTYSMIRKVPFDNEMQKLSMLSASERKNLMMLAPSAAPYVLELLRQSGAIGGVLFGITYVFMLSSRFGVIKDKANIIEAEKKALEEKKASGK